jgi:hypothetical protein
MDSITPHRGRRWRVRIRGFQCFAAGTHTDSAGTTITFTARNLEQIAEDYDPAAASAPLVLGHPKGDAEELGHVAGLVAHGGKLFALAEVSDALISAVRAGRYRNVSASFYTPGSAGNPVGPRYYLRHIGFLGATPPAVKGMAPLDFAVLPEVPRAPRHRQDLLSAALDLQAASGLQFVQAAIRAERALFARSTA